MTKKQVRDSFQNNPEANRLKQMALNLDILEENYIAPEGKVMTRFTPRFQEVLYEHTSKMGQEGKTKFDESEMGIVISKYRYEIGGYAEIDKIKAILKSDSPRFFEMCGMLNLFMVRVHNQGVDYE